MYPFSLAAHLLLRGISLALAGEWMAQSKLEAALDSARKAAAKSPQFGFAWPRVAELEFSFGHSDAAPPTARW